MKPRTASAAPSAADQAPSAGRARAAEPSPPPAAAGRPSLAIVALSEDPLLLEALTAAAIGQAAVCTSPSADRFADQLVANAAAVALIDAAVAPAPLDEFIANVHRQFPQLLVLLAGPALLQNQFAAQLADGTIFRFAHKPASAQRLKLFVDAALLRRQSVVEQAMLAPVAGGNLTAANLTGANLTGANLTGANLTGGPNPFGNSGSRRPFWVVTSIFVLLIAAAVGAVLWRRPLMSLVQAPSSGEATPGAQSSPAAAPPSADLAAQAAEAERESIDRAAADRAERDRLVSESQAREAALSEQVRRTALGARVDQAHVYLQLAQKRLAAGALIEPANDSAQDYVRSAVALAPDDADVHAVAVALGDALIGKLRAAIAAGDTETAARWLQAGRDYQINEATLAPLRSQVDTLQHSQSARAEELLALQRDFTQHLGQGQLLEPGDETAFANFRRLKALDPDNAALPMMLHSLRTAVAADVQARLARNDVTGAQQQLHSAQADGLEGEELAAAAAALGRAPATAPPDVVPEGSLQRKHFVQPVYPQDALAKNISGTVEVEFTVTSEGKVADIQVLSAEPQGMFEQATINALSQSRYQPVQHDGVAVAQRTRLRMRFKP
jgi:TonB family protein